MYNMGSRSDRTKEQFLVERMCPGMSEDTLRRAVQKWLNRSRCCLGGLNEVAAVWPYVKLL